MNHVELFLESLLGESGEEETEFHDFHGMPHHRVRITGQHLHAAKGLKPGKSHSGAALVTTYDHPKHSGTSHWATVHRDGSGGLDDVIHIKDRNTHKHITTIRYKDVLDK